MVYMRMMSIIAAAIGLGLALPEAQRGLAAGAGPFDGMWNVEVDCPDVGDVRGYNWRFPAQVSSGVLSGHYQSPTNEAKGDFSGRIRPDGQALITCCGQNRTGGRRSRARAPRNALPLHRQRPFRRA